jgi:SOS-response transcriptional repressor LexA
MQAALKINPHLIKKSRPLTEKQKDLLLFICEYLAENKTLASNSEICRHLHVSSNNAGSYLKPLEIKNYLYREPGIGYFPTPLALNMLHEDGRHEVLNKIAIRSEEQAETQL